MMNKKNIDILIDLSGVVGLALLVTTGLGRAFLGYLPMWIKIMGSVGILLSGLWCVLRWQVIKDYFTSRRFFSGTHSLAFILVLLGILVAVNFLSSRHHFRFDTTQTRKYTLSDQTRKLMGQLKEPVQVMAVYTPANPLYSQARNMLNEFAAQTPKFKLQYLDPEQNPAMAMQYGASDGKVILLYQGRRSVITGFEERDISNAINRLVNPNQRKVYFLEGHGELSIEDTEETGLSLIKTALEEENYSVSQLTLSGRSTLPDDLSVLVVPGPKTDLLPEEQTLLQSWLNKGGRMLVMVGPGKTNPFNGLLAPYQLQFNHDLVIDHASHLGQDSLVPLLTVYPKTDITRNLSVCVFPYSRTVVLPQEPPDIGVMEPLLIVATDLPYAWGETEIKRDALQYDEGKDVAPPLILGATYLKPILSNDSTDSIKSELRVIALGNVFFASNQILASRVGGSYGNRDLFLNCIAWLSDNTNVLGIRAQASEERQLSLTPGQMQLIGFVCVILIPGLIIVAGLWAWLRRR